MRLALRQGGVVLPERSKVMQAVVRTMGMRRAIFLLGVTIAVLFLASCLLPTEPSAQTTSPQGRILFVKQGTEPGENWASFTVLQAVDGITLRYAVDAWVSSPPSHKPAAFAEAVRWTEIGMNSLSHFLAGLSLFLFGLAIALGKTYPRWTGLLAALSGAALMYNGAVEVAYESFVASVVKLAGLALLALWAFVMAVLMWREGGRRGITRLESSVQRSSQRPAGSH